MAYYCVMRYKGKQYQNSLLVQARAKRDVKKFYHDDNVKVFRIRKREYDAATVFKKMTIGKPT